MSDARIEEDWAAVKLPPRLTGLPMAMWVTERDGSRHDVRVKVSPAAWVAVRPAPRLVAGQLSAADLRLVSDWIALNRPVILDYWNGTLEIDEVLADCRSCRRERRSAGRDCPAR
jgi:hypothetical protein